MTKLVTKFKYIKPDGRLNAGGYAKYIATREGVEKIEARKKIAADFDALKAKLTIKG